MEFCVRLRRKDLTLHRSHVPPIVWYLGGDVWPVGHVAPYVAPAHADSGLEIGLLAVAGVPARARRFLSVHVIRPRIASSVKPTGDRSGWLEANPAEKRSLR